MQRCIVALLSLLLFGCQDRPTCTNASGATDPAKSETSAADIDRLQGEWEIVECIHDGVSSQASKGRFLFGRDTLTADGVTGMCFRLNSATEPPQIDVFLDDKRTLLFRGIYAFRGDTLLLCETLVSEPRPKTFESRAGKKHLFYTLRRETK